jgi:hypothetical protein
MRYIQTNIAHKQPVDSHYRDEIGQSGPAITLSAPAIMRLPDHPISYGQ